MKLKSVELVGFKSFARKTKINFHPGITEIVGPNGSGKSNIIEAIRWALGEQSAKNLRSSRMTDVIFSGSQSHPALNRAKVTLDFDNRDHLIPVNYDDLTVSRTVFRDGTNNYYINNEPCRLRDVQDLFMNTGIGNGSFSIISQGQVSQIFKSKPEDRRFIIETVAGIYKYRSKKEVASKKLIKVNQNLDRLQDINYELGNQLQRLRTSRQAALNYLKQKKIANHLDIERLLVRNKLLDQHRDNDESLYQKLETRLDAANADVKRFKQRHSKVRDRIDSASRRYDRLQDQILRASHQLDKLSNRRNLNHQKVAFWRNQIKQNRAQLTKTNREVDQLNAQMFKLTSVLKRDDRKVKTLTKQLQSTSIPQHPTKDNDHHEQIDRLRKTYLNLVKKSVTINGQITNHHRNRHDQTVRLKQAKAQLSHVRQLNTKTDQQIKELNTRLDELKQDISSQVQGLDQLKGHRDQITQRLQNEQRAFNSRSRKQQTLMIRVNGLKRMASSHTNLNYGTRNLMDNADRFPGILGPVAKFIKVPTKYIQAIETTLRSQLQQIIVRDSETAKRAVRFMSERRLGRVTLLPVNEISKRWVDPGHLNRCYQCPGFIGVAANLVRMPAQFSAIKSHMLGNVLIAKDITSAINVSHAINRRYRVVTLDGNVVNAGGAITGGHGRYRYHGLLSQKAKLDGYQHELDHLNRIDQQKDSTIKGLRAQLNHVEQNVDAAQANLNQKRQQFLINTNLRKRSANEAENYQKLVDERRQLIKTYVNNDDQRESLSGLNKTQAVVKDEIKKNRQSFKRLQARISQETQAKDQKSRHYQQVREALIKCQSIQNQDRLKKETLADKIKQATRTVDHYSQINLHLKSLIDRQPVNPQHDQQFNQIQAKIKNLQKQKSVYHGTINQGQKRLAKVDDHVSDQQDRLMTLRDQINQNRLKRHDVERKQREVAETLLRKYQIDLIKQKLPVPKASLYQISSQLLNVQKQLRKLGPVDVNSIDRYKKVHHRYQFLSKQVNDLVTSKHQLITTMTQMNSKIISRFKTTFDQVNRAFKITYSQIFRGGKAKLTLINPHRLLTTGINIMAQPPGKRYRNMELLSGGERALTAIALLFAILRIKPAPFCILDEAESALDAINIDRFGDYMQKLKAKTQFIVITHRKTTMLYADNLYGVTMQNSGISKIISVNLQKAKVEG